jgi:hypothetical protein
MPFDVTMMLVLVDAMMLVFSQHLIFSLQKQSLKIKR